MKELFVAFWNVENLFDIETAARSEKIAKLVAKEIVGWNASMLKAKLSQLSKVIRAMNDGKGPDILGVCEVENRAVLDKLTKAIARDGGRTYEVAHADTSDNRGIDVAFLYDPAIATTSPEQMFQHWVVKRYATRELFQVNFDVYGGKLVLVGNHWPSRSAGQYESEPFRMTAAETLSYWLERIHQELGDNIGIVVMGDFNDEPFNRSLMEYALSSNDARRVTGGTNPYLFNLMWPLLANGEGTHYFSGCWNLLDQVMVSRGIASGKSGWQPVGQARIEGRGLMAKGGRGEPRRFGFDPADRDRAGFSDHFPVSITLKKGNA